MNVVSVSSRSAPLRRTPYLRYCFMVGFFVSVAFCFYLYFSPAQRVIQPGGQDCPVCPPPPPCRVETGSPAKTEAFVCPPCERVDSKAAAATADCDCPECKRSDHFTQTGGLYRAEAQRLLTESTARLKSFEACNAELAKVKQKVSVSQQGEVQKDEDDGRDYKREVQMLRSRVFELSEAVKAEKAKFQAYFDLEEA